jgi:hypothetical protein
MSERVKEPGHFDKDGSNPERGAKNAQNAAPFTIALLATHYTLKSI